MLAFAKNEGFSLRLIKHLLGPKGNTEFLVWLDFREDGKSVEELVNTVMETEGASPCVE